jgi:hypothetical protein
MGEVIPAAMGENSKLAPRVRLQAASIRGVRTSLSGFDVWALKVCRLPGFYSEVDHG